MANIKSAKKRISQNIKRSEVNKKRKSQIKSSIKNINTSIENKKIDDARKEFVNLESSLSKAARKGFFKRNTASRIVSRIARKLKVSGK